MEKGNHELDVGFQISAIDRDTREITFKLVPQQRESGHPFGMRFTSDQKKVLAGIDRDYQIKADELLAELMKQETGGMFADITIRGLRLIWNHVPAKEKVESEH